MDNTLTSVLSISFTGEWSLVLGSGGLVGCFVILVCSELEPTPWVLAEKSVMARSQLRKQSGREKEQACTEGGSTCA